MIKKLLPLLLILTGLNTLASELTVASYNIRVYTVNDTKEHFWRNRDVYVYQTIRDSKASIIGLNEVVLDYQGKDLEANMPEFNFIGFDGTQGFDQRQSNPAGNLIAYRPDVMELLDQGIFQLCRNTEKWSFDWDNSTSYRHCVWGKFRLIATGEIFYFFCTHLDHQGQVARMLQAHLLSDMTWKIAGHYPTIVVGDLNSSITRVNFLYRFTSNFYDSFYRTKSEEVYGPNPATSGQWNEPISGTRIDWIWSRCTKPVSYKHAEENYDLGARPSDHILISAVLDLQDPQHGKHHHYVAPGGSGDGTIDSPVGTLADAIKIANHGDTIYMAAGEYPIDKVMKITKFVHVFGGYDSDYKNVDGLSKLQVTAPIRCIELNDTTELELRNIGIYNGAPASSDGGAIRGKYGRLVLRNCEFADNQSVRDGGAIDHMGQIEIYNSRFLRNKAGRNGGAVCCDNPNKRYWFNFPIDGNLFDSNEAANSGGAFHLPRFIYAWISNNTITNNVTLGGPTVFLQAYNADNTLGSQLTVWNNTVTNNVATGVPDDTADPKPLTGASAFYIHTEPEGAVAIANNTIVANTSLSGYPAIYMNVGQPFIGNNIVACNEGGDVFLNVENMSASYNFYTSEETVNFPRNSKDFTGTDYNSAAQMLCNMLNCKMEDGKVVPQLTVADNAGYFTAPTLTVVNPTHTDGRSLCCVTALRLKETSLRADFDRDCMRESTLTTDALGRPRPTNGKTTIGAVEYVESNSIEQIAVANNEAENGTAVEWFDLTGRRVASPANGIYIRRCGSRVEKVAVR